MIQTRRCFVATASAVTTASLLHMRPTLADEGPAETTTIRIGKFTII
jgi:hypothetical protein